MYIYIYVSNFNKPTIYIHTHICVCGSQALNIFDVNGGENFACPVNPLTQYGWCLLRNQYVVALSRE